MDLSPPVTWVPGSKSTYTRVQISGASSFFRGLLIGKLDFARGVDIFFVISGFIMVVSNRKTPPGRFLVKRIIRVAPLYWVLTTLLVFLDFLLPNEFRTTEVSPAAYFKSLLFIPYCNAGHSGEVFPLLVPGWSLNFEMFFYLLFSVTLFLPKRFRLVAMGAALGAIVIVGALPGMQALPKGILFYTNIGIFEFWLGMCIAQLYLRQTLSKVSSLPAVVVVVLATLILLWPSAPASDAGRISQLLGRVLPAAAIVLGVVLLERPPGPRRFRFLHWLGDASYSIYLSHIFSFGLARLVWRHLGLDDPTVPSVLAFTLFAMGLMILGAWATHTVVEKPSLAFLDRLLLYRNRFDPSASVSVMKPPR